MTIAQFKARAMTLAEVLVSLLIVGVAMTAGVQALGSFAMGSRAWQERSAATQLAAQLMSEINALAYEDPAGSIGIGRESGETTGNRTQYDDVDDYDGWNESPPKDSTGTVLSAYTGYRQKVTVAYDTSLAAKTGLTFTGGSAKMITVTISKDDKVLARMVTVRTQHRANG